MSKVIKFGFTGTRNGMTNIQNQSVTVYLKQYILEYGFDLESAHGDCVGSDSEFHIICESLSINKIHIYPPIKNTFRAYVQPSIKDIQYVYNVEQDYLRRNQDIVNFCDILIATPEGIEKRRSGTWSTIRYAKKNRKNVIIFYPNGEIQKHYSFSKR